MTNEALIVALSKQFDPDSDAVRSVRSVLGPGEYVIDGRVRLHGHMRVAMPYEMSPQMRPDLDTLLAHAIALRRELYRGIRLEDEVRIFRGAAERTYAKVEVDGAAKSRWAHEHEHVREQFIIALPKISCMGKTTFRGEYVLEPSAG